MLKYFNRKLIYGTNVIDVEVKSYARLFFEEVLIAYGLCMQYGNLIPLFECINCHENSIIIVVVNCVLCFTGSWSLLCVSSIQCITLDVWWVLLLCNCHFYYFIWIYLTEYQADKEGRIFTINSSSCCFLTYVVGQIPVHYYM